MQFEGSFVSEFLSLLLERAVCFYPEQYIAWKLLRQLQFKATEASLTTNKATS